ncbi:MAG: hypothetical protein WC211_01475 [Dehalococcoidia bacterium]
MTLIPVYWLLLGLAGLTGVQPPPDVPRSMLALVHDVPAPYSGYNCADGVGVLDPVCPAGRGIGAGDVVIDEALWATPYAMQHVVMHEVGHRRCGSDERCAEAYACRWVPMAIAASGVECRLDGTIR